MLERAEQIVETHASFLRAGGRSGPRLRLNYINNETLGVSFQEVFRF
jgi:hypothetical protein